MCWREATSGKTPPYLACRSIWDATTLEIRQRPSTMIAAAVSSQEDSIPNTRADGKVDAVLFSIIAPKYNAFCHNDLTIISLISPNRVNGSMGFAVEGSQIWGCERANARSHPQI